MFIFSVSVLNLLCINNPFWCLEIPSALLFIKNQKTDGRYQVQKVFIEGDHWKTKIHKRYPIQTAKQKNQNEQYYYSIYIKAIICPNTMMCRLVQSSPDNCGILWTKTTDNINHTNTDNTCSSCTVYNMTGMHGWVDWDFFCCCRGSIRGCKHTWCIQPSVMVVDSIAIAWLVSYLKALMALLEVVNTVADHSRVT